MCASLFVLPMLELLNLLRRPCTPQQALIVNWGSMDPKDATVPLSLKRFLRDGPHKVVLLRALNEASNRLADIRTQAAELRLLHVTRVLEGGGQPVLDPNFFNRSYYTVSLPVENAHNVWQQYDPALAQTAFLY